ncbi:MULTISPECIES: CYTH and CHAD domain-containing protein [unclassified Chelatococcus]|uniref:CYTH and CHAD domain-containing protein n=1 Tax=unclassified Chelatococcus TaxID=2638111 RepID=UPI0020C133CB|nr:MULTISPECIES: CYTH and CHAD domain-containing protein [unclassified Chelatococcus]MCO5079043.1 CHAD domain-containing protein [Chelatococcus sp.]
MSGSTGLDAMPSDADHSDDSAPKSPQAETPREIELKLLAPPGVLKQIHDAPIIVQHARNKGSVRLLEAVYFDTPDHKLSTHGVSLRVRRSGKRCIQTIKLPPDISQLSRPEWETPVSGMAPELGLFPLAEIGGPLENLSVDEIAPVFTTRVRRWTRIIALPSATVELAFDEGAIEAGDKQAPLSEIELELKGGDIGALYDFGLALLELAPLQFGTESKAERGFALARDAAPAAARAAPSDLKPEDSVDAAIAKLLMGCHAHMVRNTAAAAHGKTQEGVHQMRVALRRMRTALSMFHREIPAPCLKQLSADAKAIARALGDARNWDVFCTSTVQTIADLNLPGFNAEALRSAAEPIRQQSYTDVRAMLAAQHTNRFSLSLGRIVARRTWRNDIDSETLTILTEPVAALAERTLSRLHRKALKQGSGFSELEPEARHGLRLTLKKLRYATEFFLPLFEDDNSAKGYLRRLSKLQDALGVDNDVTTTEHLLSAVAARSQDPGVHRGIGLMAGWLARDRVEAMKSLGSRWKAFKGAEPFWKA